MALQMDWASEIEHNYFGLEDTEGPSFQMGNQQGGHSIEGPKILSPMDFITAAYGCEPWCPQIGISPQGLLSDLSHFVYPQFLDAPVLDFSDESANSALTAAQWNYPNPITATSNPYQGPTYNFPSSLAYWDSQKNLESDTSNSNTTNSLCSTLNSPQSFDNQDPEPEIEDERADLQSPEALRGRQVKTRTKRLRPAVQTSNSSDKNSSTTPSNRKRRNWKLSPEINTGPKSRPVVTTRSPKGRHKHNQIEKKYRSKLNQHFEILLAVLPPTLVTKNNTVSKATRKMEKTIGKSDVLSLAKGYIEELKEGMEVLGREHTTLLAEVSVLKELCCESE